MNLEMLNGKVIRRVEQLHLGAYLELTFLFADGTSLRLRCTYLTMELLA